MERQKITHSWLLEHGYSVDEGETQMLRSYLERYTWCKDPLTVYYNEDRRICIRHEWTNRYGEGYGIHIDNQDYDSVGSLDVLYIDELENFIKLAYDESSSNI